MNLYLDDDSAKTLLVVYLRRAGHGVVVPGDVGLVGADDAKHLLHAVKHSLVLLSKNFEDFITLHLLIQACAGRHPGIILIRQDNDYPRDMKDRDIVRAIGNLAAAGIPIENELYILNQWR